MSHNDNESGYLEILDVRTGEIRKTGKGAIFDSEAETRAAFARAKSIEKEDGPFWLDLHDAEGNLVDTINLDEEGFEKIVGEKPAEPEVYVDFDTTYWIRQIENHQEAKS